MKNCRACLKPIPETAHFCPHCGASVIEETIVCPNCGEENDLHNSSCSKCGCRFFPDESEPQPKSVPNDIFDTSHTEALERDLADHFSRAFQRRLEEEHAPKYHSALIDLFYKSDFKKTVDFRIQHLAEEIRKLEDAGNNSRKAKKVILDNTFDELLDFFLIRYANGLVETHFLESILKYQGLPLEKIKLNQMVMDYLDFGHEEETVYTNFVTMPAPKLKNAAESFLFPKKGETIFFICDLSILGNVKEGFAMTSEAIYWKAMLEKPQRVYYRKLREIKRQEDWITINGIFFNANKSLNLKLLRLLKKLKQLFLGVI